ncbi:MAG: FUSC family protein [Motilibacteraceae bacterium]
MRDGVRSRLAETRDRVLASDPGLGRLRQALAATVALGTALAVEYVFARLSHAGAQGTLVAMMLGAIVAMMGANALAGPERWGNVKVAVFFPVAIGVGMAVGTLTARNTDVMLSVFVVVMFVAVFIRRFGLPFFFYGFMVWMGYFFASFLRTTPTMLPHLLLAVVIGSAWVLLLSVTVLRTDPRRVLRATLRSFDGRARRVTSDCADLLGSRTGRRERARLERRLLACQAGLAEAALMAEGWSDDEGALPPGWSGPALRRHLLETQQAVERMAAASTGLVGADERVRAAAGELMELLARRDDVAASRAAEALAAAVPGVEDPEAAWHLRHLSAGAVEFLALEAEVDGPPEVAGTDDFAPTTGLFFGNLPGSPAVAREVPARGARWNPLTTLDMTTRQAVQVALAGALSIVLGRWLDPSRYYWAVIAAFVMFTGTATRSESFLKGVNRVLGTLAGLVAAIAFAHVTVGHTGWIVAVILLSVFFGFYLIRISYAYMIFFITIMIGQLYTVLHTFTDGLLVLRLEETAVGAVAGIAVALLVAPLSTRDTARTAERALLESLAELLDGVADTVAGHGEPRDLDALSRGLDDRARRLELVSRPLTRPLVWGNQSQQTRHRLGLYLSTAVYARGLVVAVRRAHGTVSTAVPDTARALAAACAGLVEATAPSGGTGQVPDLRERRTGEDGSDRVRHEGRGEVADQLAVAESSLFRTGPGAGTGPEGDDALRALLHLQAALAELAPGQRPAASSPPATVAATT